MPTICQALFSMTEKVYCVDCNRNDTCSFISYVIEVEDIMHNKTNTGSTYLKE